MALSKDQLHAALVDSAGVSEAQFEKAASSKEATVIGIDRVLTAHGVITDQQLGQLMGIWYKVPYVSLRNEKDFNEGCASINPDRGVKSTKLIG